MQRDESLSESNNTANLPILVVEDFLSDHEQLIYLIREQRSLSGQIHAQICELKKLEEKKEEITCGVNELIAKRTANSLKIREQAFVRELRSATVVLKPLQKAPQPSTNNVHSSPAHTMPNAPTQIGRNSVSTAPQPSITPAHAVPETPTGPVWNSIPTIPQRQPNPPHTENQPSAQPSEKIKQPVGRPPHAGNQPSTQPPEKIKRPVGRPPLQPNKRRAYASETSSDCSPVPISTKMPSPPTTPPMLSHEAQLDMAKQTVQNMIGTLQTLQKSSDSLPESSAVTTAEAFMCTYSTKNNGPRECVNAPYSKCKHGMCYMHCRHLECKK